MDTNFRHGDGVGAGIRRLGCSVVVQFLGVRYNWGSSESLGVAVRIAGEDNFIGFLHIAERKTRLSGRHLECWPEEKISQKCARRLKVP